MRGKGNNMSWKNILQHFKMDWVLEDRWYVMFSNSPTPYSVKKYLNRNIEKAKKMMASGKLPNYRYKFKCRDQIMLECFKWVVQNIKYKGDKSNFGQAEYWEDIDVIIENGEADCESMTLLLYCLARINYINPLQMKYTTGRVKTIKKPILGEGHCWLEYMADSTMMGEKWYIVDPAYAPNNITKFRYRKDLELSIEYVKRWFQITDLDIEGELWT